MNEWIAVQIEATTDMSIGVRNLNDKLVWIPRSQIVDSSDELVKGTAVEIELPEWLLLEKDLV